MSARVAGAERMASWPRWAGANLLRGLAVIFRPLRARPKRRTYRGLLAASLAAPLMLAAAMLLADATVASAVKSWPGWVHVTFGFLSGFGNSGWFLWPTGTLLLAIAALASPALAPVHRLVLAAVAVRVGFLLVAIALPGLIVSVVKRSIGRARPFVGEAADPFLYMQFVWRADYASLPSGHATTAFAAAVAVAVLWPRLRLPMLAYALVIAASRVVIDVHYFSDVIAGAIVGTVGALIVRDWFAARRLGFSIGADGRVRALPGPGWARVKKVGRRFVAR